MSVAVIQSGRFGFSPLDLSPALWIDPSVASSVTISGSSGAYIGPNGLVLPGSGTNVAVSVDVGATRPTGDFTLFADVTATDWTPAAFYHIASSGDTAAPTTSNWYLYLQTTGTIILYRPTGATGRTYTSSVATGVTDGTRKKIKVTFDQDNGSTQSEVKFYLSDDGLSWTQLGTTQTNASTGAGNSNTTAPRFGLNTGLTGAFGGTIHRVALWSDLTETTKVLDADFEAATPYVSAFTESALGAPVYVVSSTATSATANYSYVGPTGLVCSGVGTTAIAASSDTADRYEIAGDIDIIVKASASDWTPSVVKCPIGRSSSSAQSWYMRLLTTGEINLAWVDTGAVVREASSTVATGLTDGATKWFRATLDVDNGAGGNDAKFYLSDDGSSWTQLGTTVTQAFTTDIRASVNDMRVGSRYSGTDNTWSGTIMRAIVKNGIGGTAVFDADFVSAVDYATSFTETGTGAGTVSIDTTNTPSAAAGALVSQINDLSGNARHLTQGTAANMPRYWNGRNGLNCLVGGDTTDKLNAATAADWNFMHNGTVWLLGATWRPRAASASERFLIGNNANESIVRGFSVYGTTVANQLILTMSNGANKILTQTVSDGITDNAWGVNTILADPSNATASARASMYLNGGAANTSNALTGTPSALDAAGPIAVMGGRAYNFGPVGITGEIVIASGANATEANRTSLRDYQNPKWAVY